LRKSHLPLEFIAVLIQQALNISSAHNLPLLVDQGNEDVYRTRHQLFAIRAAYLRAISQHSSLAGDREATKVDIAIH
jgi:hypothetical protein